MLLFIRNRQPDSRTELIQMDKNFIDPQQLRFSCSDLKIHIFELIQAVLEKLPNLQNMIPQLHCSNFGEAVQTKREIDAMQITE